LCTFESCFLRPCNLSNGFPVVKKRKKTKSCQRVFTYTKKSWISKQKKVPKQQNNYTFMCKLIAFARYVAPVGPARSSAPAAPTAHERAIIAGALERARRVVARERATPPDAFERTLVSHSNAMQFT
jgi:hypothetical protein